MSSISADIRYTGSWAPKSPAYGGSGTPTSSASTSLSIADRLPKEKSTKGAMMEVYFNTPRSADSYTPGSRR
ncbi:hypothetical protein N7450_009516 [Penicillium hetheringtonii]|uniref:Uncharacterized protein n=1 Tax=Penicillium hetheringtonii TaxID=911720 RepID=A0AAD6DB25_9EURO|nr:hypothetical protein N7450_009516 [Penicillium hetheringtonii]